MKRIKKSVEEFTSNADNFRAEISNNYNKVQDVASKNVDRISGEVQNQIGVYGKEAMKNLENAREDAARKITEFSKNFEGTANDLSNYANTKGQESLDDVQQWFKDKLVFFQFKLINFWDSAKFIINIIV